MRLTCRQTPQPVSRNARCSDQHRQRRRYSQSCTHVVGFLARLARCAWYRIRIARTTGTYPVSEFRQALGYVYKPDKFGRAGMTRVVSDTVRASRALECPIQLEAVVAAAHGIGEYSEELRGFLSLIEVRIQRVHVHPDLLMEGHANRFDPDKWLPLIMSFQKFYGLSGQVHTSRLADIPERAYEPLSRV
jgi:hypothetical protein